MSKDYKYSNIEDFILDESFCQYVTGTHSESIDFWNSWIIDNPDKKKDFNSAVNVLKVLYNKNKITVPVNKGLTFKSLLQKVEQEERNAYKINRFIASTWFKVAAIIILAIGISFLWNLIKNINTSEKDIKYCEIIVPIGEKSKIILVDGTSVWINSGSHFKYPVNFGEKNREVYLSGEAYFDVTKHKGKTFIVSTRDVRVNVLGTAFDVKCYPEDSKTQTTVVRGLVKVESINGKDESPIYLRPNQMVSIKAEKLKNTQNNVPLYEIQHIEIRKVNTVNITCWKDRLLVFYDETFEDMALKMERWYNVKIIIQNEKLKKERYTGKFIKDENIYQVLEAIKATTPIKYKVKDNEVTITSNK
jgi:transmembrane sensor